METTIFTSQIGIIAITSDAECLVNILVENIKKCEQVKSPFNDYVNFQLKEYFSGKRTDFDVPIKFLIGSDFDKKVWASLLTIPYGQTLSYQEVAVNIGNSKASRAVGNSVGRNPLPIIVPCHRVIRSDGSIGGFSLDINIKKELLKIEQMDGLKKNY